VERRALRALCALTVASVFACGLEKSGLLSAVDGGDDGPVVDDGAAADATRVDGSASKEGGQIADARGDETEAGADVALDVQADGRVDAPADGRADARLDAPFDAPPDTGPLPIVWDGGAIADPVFLDGDWVSFCVALASCGEMSSVSGCVALLHQPSSSDALLPPPNTVANVINAGADCASVGSALGDGSACSVATLDSCTGDSLTTCRWGFRMTIDCSTLGMTCSSGNGNPGCGFGDCSPSQEAQTFCVGTNYVAQCASGRYAPKVDCQVLGGTCIGPDGTAQCQGAGGACDGGSGCVGTSLSECMAGQLGSADCKALYDQSFMCILDDGGTPICAAGTACDPTSTADTCTAAKLNFCNAGAPTSYDCSGNWNLCDAGRCTL
jgi:hypothetical protein